MSRTPWLLGAALVASLVAGACGGGGSTPAPGSSAAPGSSTAPGTPALATSIPATTVPATGGTSEAPGGEVGGAAAALENLSSYRYTMTMAAEGKGNFMLVTAGGSLIISGTVILKPVMAMDMTMTTKDASGAATALGYRIIGTEAYANIGGDTWMSMSAGDAEKTIDSFKPQNLMAGLGSLESMSATGDETRNGIATTHYRGTAPALVGSMFGLPTGTWTMEAWVARDGGYLVGSALLGQASDGRFTMTIDISDLDSPSNKVEKPANVGG